MNITTQLPYACFIAKSEGEKKSHWKAFYKYCPQLAVSSLVATSTTGATTVILFNTFYDPSLPNCFPILPPNPPLAPHLLVFKIWLRRVQQIQKFRFKEFSIQVKISISLLSVFLFSDQ